MGRRVGILLPLLITATMALTLCVWSARFPDPLAIHWAGGPNGFISKAAFIPIAVLLTAGTSLPPAVAALTSGRSRWTTAHRVLVAFAPALAAFSGTLMLFLAHGQLDLATAAQAPSPALGIPLIVGAAMWVLSWFAAPGPDLDAQPEKSAWAPIAADAAKEWHATLSPDGPLLIFVSITMAPLVVLSIWSLTAREEGWWILPLTLVATALLLISFLVFRVHITAGGLEARSILGWPTIRVSAAEIACVEVKVIDPLGDFGGWGLRWGRKRIGLVFRSGEGILITRTDGRVVGITIDDAERAAAVLAAGLERPAT